MIKNIRFKFGSAKGMEHTEIELSPITVFVGPNNSGKSKVLLEIQRFCQNGKKNQSNLILDDIIFEQFSVQSAEEILAHVTLKPIANETIQIGHVIVGKNANRTPVPKESLIEAMENPNEALDRFCGWYLKYHTIILNGNTRINLTNTQDFGDLQMPPHTSFQVLFRNDEKRKEVRRIIYEAIGDYFVIDPTSGGQLRIRFSKSPPSNDIDERGIHKEAVEFHAAAMPIEETSDGVKAFTGMITEIIAGDPKILLIDEPEAFLHPPLSYKLGKEIAQATVGTDKRIFASTHSSNFVMGCIQSGVPVNIVRLTYRDEQATARVLPEEKLLQLMRNPLLRSTGVLEGLFYEYVVVTEADADRAFYQEINDRLLKLKPEWGIPNCLFINAQNKQTIKTILKPLRELGIPTIGIVDIDILKDGGREWTGFLESVFIPEVQHAPLGAQ